MSMTQERMNGGQTMGAFYDTKLFFQTSVTKVNNYEEWMSVPDSQKAACLYVTFFNQIQMAWNRTKSFYTPEEDGVSCELQYLEKNVQLIKENSKKFDPRYIYRISFNALYCICHDIIKDRQRWEIETSNIVGSGSDEINLFDDYVGGVSQDNDLEMIRDRMWAVIESLGEEGLRVVDSLINNDTLRRSSKQSPNYEQDRFKDISVSVARASEIIEVLKILLAPFKDAFYN